MVSRDHADHYLWLAFALSQFPFGKFFEKGLTMGCGQANVKSYNRQLRDLIVAGIAKPSFIVSKEVNLSEASDAYDRFQKREAGEFSHSLLPFYWKKY